MKLTTYITLMGVISIAAFLAGVWLSGPWYTGAMVGLAYLCGNLNGHWSYSR